MEGQETGGELWEGECSRNLNKKKEEKPGSMTLKGKIGNVEKTDMVGI